ncbi:cytochrome P450 [Thermoleophilia bacterium SCSIO 60948]|nr:cytochrome P450 [Thermoleophilia bacterium SCSIO 60948]
MPTNPLQRIVSDLARERRTPTPYPPGDTRPSPRRTRQFIREPLPLLLDAYERYGPVFTLRIFHHNVVFMIGAEANHFVTVSHPELFRWRDGHMGELTPLIGHGLLTTDGAEHRTARKLMLPAFHRERLAATLDTMLDETDRGLDTLTLGKPVDLYHWTRRLALRIAMRCLFGLDPGRARAEIDAAHEFEVALGFHGHDVPIQMLRGPGTPWHRMLRARRRLDALIYAEIADRRRRGGGEDLLTMLVAATDEDGRALDDRQIRDQVMTLLFAGHDTTTATIAFLFYELARHPHVLAGLEAEVAQALQGCFPGYGELMGGGLPRLDAALDETLRLYPAAWLGPRRAQETFEFAGGTIPRGAYVEYSSWATHHLPELFPEPEAFRPERFTDGSVARLPKGAYLPFGGGSRTCIGMRFGQLEIKASAARMLPRLRLELQPGYRLETRQTPTLGPRRGMPMTVRAA